MNIRKISVGVGEGRVKFWSSQLFNIVMFSDILATLIAVARGVLEQLFFYYKVLKTSLEGYFPRLSTQRRPFKKKKIKLRLPMN